MIHIKEEYLKGEQNYLCHIASCLGVQDEFQEYLNNNLDDTMINLEYKDRNEARWYSEDVQGRINWLNKHIEILENK
jgi:hypothetical protein